MKSLKKITAGKRILSLGGKIVPRSRKVTVLGPLPHLLVRQEPPVRGSHHLPWGDKWPRALEELEEESVELLLRGHVFVSPVQLGEKQCLHPRPNRLLGVCFTRVWGLKHDLEVRLHLRHV